MEIEFQIKNAVREDIRKLINDRSDAYEVLKCNPIYKQQSLILIATQTLKKGNKDLEKHRTNFMKYMPYGEEQRNIIDIDLNDLQKDLDHCKELLSKEHDYINYNKLEMELRKLQEFESLLF